MKKYTMKSAVALLLAFCMLMGCMPLAMAQELGQQAIILRHYPKDAKLDASGWVYRIREDGYAEVLGHQNDAASSLSIPAKLGGVDVAAIGEDAFAANAKLATVTIPASVGEIEESAFAAQPSLTVRAYNGSAALSFAEERGYAAQNRSEYDFFDSVIDLSEMKSAQWSRDGKKLIIKGQYAELIEQGDIVYLPDGMPVSVDRVERKGDRISADCSDADFVETIESYKVENMVLRPDWSTIKLHDGVELVSSGMKPKDSRIGGEYNYEKTVRFKIDQGGGFSLSGMAGINLRYVLSLDYEWSTIKQLSFTSDVNASASITQSFEYKGSVKSKEKPLFSIQLVGYGLASIWVDVAIKYSLDAKATISTSISVHDSFSWTPNSGVKKNSSVDYKKPVLEIFGTATVGIVPSARVVLGFGYSQASIGVAEINPYLGLRGKYFFNSYTLCHDISVYADAQVDIRIGILKARRNSKIPEKVLYSGTLYQGEKLIFKTHWEHQTGRFQDECSFQKGLKVSFYLKPGELWQIAYVEKGNVLPEMTMPVRPGYIFNGWYRDAACTKPWTFDTPVTKSISLYAGWKQMDTDYPYFAASSAGGFGYPGEYSYVTVSIFSDGKIRHLCVLENVPDIYFPVELPGGIIEIGRLQTMKASDYRKVEIKTDNSYTGDIGIFVPSGHITELVIDATSRQCIADIYYSGSVLVQYIWGNLPETAYVGGSTALYLAGDATNETKYLTVGPEVKYLYIYDKYLKLEKLNLLGDTQVFVDSEDYNSAMLLSHGNRWIVDRATGDGITEENKDTSVVLGNVTPNGSGGTLVSLHEAAGDVVIPEQIGGMTITALAADCIPAGVTAVEIPAGVAAIDENAFRIAEDLERIMVSADNAQYHAKDGVLYHQDGTLVCYPQAKTEESYIVPEGTSAIGPRAISGAANLKTLTLPESLTMLHDRAIYDCPALERADFAADPQWIGMYVFADCPNLAVYGPLGYTYLEYICSESGIGYNEYAVSFMSGDELLFAMPASAGLQIDYIPGPENSEKIIKGWSTTKDGKKLWDFDNDLMPERDLTLYAFWGYDFDYTIKNGKVTLTKYLAVDDAGYEIHVPETVDGKPVIAIAPDTFDGLPWYPTLIGNRGSVTEAFAAEYGFYFNPLAYTLKFEANGGRLYPMEQTLCATDVITLPETERDNYEFTGWYSDSACKKPFADGTAMPTSDLTLYAGWEKIDESIADSLFTYESTEEDYVTITGYLGEEINIVIPEEINGWTVSSIGAFAFAGSDVFRIVLPDTVSFVEEYAFSNCKNLTHVELQSYDIWGVSEIGTGAFGGCTALKEITLPDTLEHIGSRAFAGSGLTMLNIPASVSSIYVDCVRDCKDLVYLEVDDENEWLEDKGGAIYRNGDLLIWPAGQDVDDDFVFDSSIGDYALSGIDCVTATVGRNIGYEAMSDCMNLRKVTFKDAYIEERAFANCPVLTELEFMESEYSGRIDANAFVGSPIKTIRFNGAGNYWLADDAFPVSEDLTIYGPANSDVEQWALDHGVRFVSENTVLAEAISLGRESMALSVGRSAQFGVTFTPENATETEIEWSSSAPHVATVYGDGVVIGLSEGSAVITATAVGGAQAQCVVSVKADEYPVKMELPSALKVLEAEAFAGSGFVYVRCPLGMKSIGSRAFADCAALQVIEIPGSVESIADDAFDGSENVTVYAPLGSYAIEWAKENGVSYLEE